MSKCKGYKISDYYDVYGKGPLVYKIMNKINHKIYVGRDKNSICKDKLGHCGGCKSSRVYNHWLEATKMGFIDDLEFGVMYTPDYIEIEPKIIASIPEEISTNIEHTSKAKKLGNTPEYINKIKTSLSKHFKQKIYNPELTCKEMAKLNNVSESAMRNGLCKNKLEYKHIPNNFGNNKKGGRC